MHAVGVMGRGLEQGLLRVVVRAQLVTVLRLLLAYIAVALVGHLCGQSGQALISSSSSTYRNGIWARVSSRRLCLS